MAWGWGLLGGWWRTEALPPPPPEGLATLLPPRAPPRSEPAEGGLARWCQEATEARPAREQTEARSPQAAPSGTGASAAAAAARPAAAAAAGATTDEHGGFVTVAGKPVAMFCINLTSRPDRWQTMQSRLRLSFGAQAAAEVERVEAVAGARLSDDDLRRHLTPRAYHLLKHRAGVKPRLSCMDLGSPNAVGCYLSHVKIWEAMRDRGLDYALVLEDDAHFAPGFVGAVQTLLDEMTALDRDGILNVGFWEGFNPGTPVSARLFESHNLDCGTHAYVLSARAAAYLLAQAFPIEVQLDSAMHLWLRDGWPNASGPAPRRFRPVRALAYQNIDDSDIQTDCLHTVADEMPEQHLRRRFG